MDLGFLYNYIVPTILGICLCIGFILKYLIKTDKINNFIPLIMGGLGVILAIWTNHWVISPEIILTGLMSGLASTGLYEAFKNVLKAFSKKDKPISIEEEQIFEEFNDDKEEEEE